MLWFDFSQNRIFMLFQVKLLSFYLNFLLRTYFYYLINLNLIILSQIIVFNSDLKFFSCKSIKLKLMSFLNIYWDSNLYFMNWNLLQLHLFSDIFNMNRGRRLYYPKIAVPKKSTLSFIIETSFVLHFFINQLVNVGKHFENSEDQNRGE